MELSKKITCGHCYNIAPMEIMGSVNNVAHVDAEEGGGYEEGYYYDILICPACTKTNIISYFWHSWMDSDNDTTVEVLYPKNTKYPLGLPPDILKAYEAADKIKAIDAGIYAIALRKVLELVCEDKKAKGRFLAHKVKYLADHNEIPNNLVKVAEGLKDFGNIGAHAGIGSLSPKEIPIAESLCRAILEYVYSAPHLAALAESQLESIKRKKPPKKKP